jgi:iron(III) transport system permease protein
MLRFRWLPIAARCLLGLVQAALLLGLLAAVVVDRGPEGEPRLTSHLLPLALWVFDDFAWTCARNSLVFAAAMSLGALALGVALRSQLGSLRSWRRSGMASAAVAVLAASPAFMALGLTGLLGSPHGWPWPFFTPHPASGGTSLESWRGLPFLLVWLWATLPSAVAWVWLAAEPSFGRLEPSWTATAQVAGARWLRIFRDLSWPIIRPSAARAAGQIFVFALFEPGAPLILGLRRSLAYQMVDAAVQPEVFPRLAVWVVMTSLFAVAGWLLFRWRGGRPILDAGESGDAPRVTLDHPIATTSPRAWLGILLLAGWSLVAWLPVVGLVHMALGSGSIGNSSRGSFHESLPGGLQSLADPQVRELAGNSLFLGLEVACGLTLISWLIPRGPAPARSRLWDRLIRPNMTMPGLVTGSALLALPWLGAVAASFAAEQGWPKIGMILENSAALLDPDQSSRIPLACAVGLFLLPWLLSSNTERPAADRNSRHADSAYEAAILAGASRWRARTLGMPIRPLRALGRFALVWAFAATNVTPALLFVSRPTVGSGILSLATQSGESSSRAAALAVCAIAINLTALAIARMASALPRVDRAST